MRRLVQRLRLPLLVPFLLSAGCPAPAPQVEPSPVEPAAAETPAEPAEPQPAAGPLVDAEQMARIAEGHRPLEALVAPSRGLVYVLYATDASGEDPRADDDGMIRLAEHWCTSEELTDNVDRLQRDLARRMRDRVREPLFECVDDRCEHPAQMEYDVAGHYEFAPVEGFEGPALIAVEHVESAGMTEDFLAEAEIFVRDQRAAHAGATCD